jgi:peroxiredoxin
MPEGGCARSWIDAPSMPAHPAVMTNARRRGKVISGLEASAVTSENHMHPLTQAIQAAFELDAPLRERLGMVAEAVRRHRPDQAEAVDRLVSRLSGHHAGALAPAVGERLPEFVLPDENGILTRLADLRSKGPVVVVFQRGHWCPYCRLNTIGIAEIQDEIFAAGAGIVAIVPERARFARLLKETAKARFPFLTDSANGYALSLNLAIWIGLEMEGVMTEAGIDLPRYHGNSAWFLPIPATFIVRSDGTVAARYVDPDHRQRMDLDDLLAAVKRAHLPRGGTSRLHAAS